MSSQGRRPDSDGQTLDSKGIGNVDEHQRGRLPSPRGMPLDKSSGPPRMSQEPPPPDRPLGPSGRMEPPMPRDQKMPVFPHEHGGGARPPPMPPGRGLMPGRGRGWRPGGMHPPDQQWNSMGGPGPGRGPGRGPAPRPGPVPPAPGFPGYSKRPRMEVRPGGPGWMGPGMWGPPPNMPPGPDWGPQGVRPPMMDMVPSGNFPPPDNFLPPADPIHSGMMGPGHGSIGRGRMEADRQPPPPPGWGRPGGESVGGGSGGRERWTGQDVSKDSGSGFRAREGWRNSKEAVPGRATPQDGARGWEEGGGDLFDRQKDAAEVRVRQQLEKVGVSPSLCSKEMYEKYLKAAGKGSDEVASGRLQPSDHFFGHLLLEDNGTFAMRHPSMKKTEAASVEAALQRDTWQKSEMCVKTARSMFELRPDEMRVLRHYCPTSRKM
ncbi:hypothetical protein BSKO_06327 [Bryopsis sp. KO-2023]|nr:hypothetical protein BSKO_06327 [Bryopsis sp. KO-2023]